MPISPDEAVARTAAVLVTFHTQPERVEAVLRSLEGLIRVVVDNSGPEHGGAGIGEVARAEGALFESMEGNLGIAAAQNAGLRAARAAGAERVVLVDDDTDLDVDDVAALSRALDSAIDADPTVAGIGPLLVDRRSGEGMWFEWRGDRVKFVRTTGGPAQGPLTAAFLIASGSLLRLDALDAVGPFRDDYFIDHVDREWGLRAGVLGWRLLLDPAIRVEHSLGDAPDVTDGGAVYRHTSSLRLYYGTRNSFLLVRDVALPIRRRATEAAFAAYVAATQWRAADHAGRTQIRRGIGDALRGRRGPVEEAAARGVRGASTEDHDRREGVR